MKTDRKLEHILDKTETGGLITREEAGYLLGFDELSPEARMMRACADMRRADDRDSVFTAYSEASAEAESCFGDGQLYVEKLIIDPKHIEIQILADGYGNVIHLGERNCSIQRRNQKMVEEAPDWTISPALRDEMGHGRQEHLRIVRRRSRCRGGAI